MGTLYVVATPIGNLEDTTLRAIRVLGACDLVLAEDTRRTRVLLEHHGISARPRSLHAHNEAHRVREVLACLEGGGRAALVSDAGTPLISDPGERLVAAAREAGHRVEPLPGASAVLAALVGSGLPATPFTFLGFLPRRAGARDARLAELAGRAETLVLFESPRRLPATLAALARALGPRRACVARELTKLHETFEHGRLDELAERLAEGVRGEVTLVVEGAAEAPALSDGALDTAVAALLAEGRSPRQVAEALAARSGRPKREVYRRALELRDGA